MSALRSNRHVSLVQEAQAGLAKISPSTIAPATPTITQTPLVDTRGQRRGESPPSTTNPAFPDTGPSPSLPPRPTPAPAQLSVQQRRGSGPASHGAPWMLMLIVEEELRRPARWEATLTDLRR
ncbi:unnamed protein product [Ectocarpus sp. 13 AM-2016]